MTKILLLSLPTLLLLAACAGKPDVDEGAAAPAAAPLLLVNEDVVNADRRAFGQGPVIAGSLQPERRADLRAEVAGIVLAVLHDDGDQVSAGELLVRLDPTALRDQLLSADEAERAAKVSLDQAVRQLERMQALAGKGLVTAENLETAESRRNQTQSDLASARARAVQARQQMSRTEVRAPFDGVVSGRVVSAGDTAQVGKQLMMVIVPSTMRFEGLIAADQVGRVKPGNAVSFRVNGYAGTLFKGSVQRVNPMANEATRQVQVLVAFTAPVADLVAGLYAEGRIEVASRHAISVPDSAVIREGDDAFVWQLSEGSLQRRAVELGEQNARDGHVEILAGLEAGSQVLRHPLGALKEGAAVQMAGPAAAASGAEITAQTASGN